MKNKEIQGLRAIAVLGVVLYHANFKWIPGGYLGVDVFFVISGYLISQLITKELSETGRTNLPNFYARRLRRLLPAAILVIISTIAVGKHLVSPVRFRDLGFDALASIFYASNYRFYLSQTDYLNIGEKPSLFLHFWSLAVEEQFYLFWPILLFIGWQFYKKFGMFIVLVLALVSSFYYSLIISETDPLLAFYSLPSRVWEFALGALTFLIVSKIPNVPKFFRFIFGWSGISALVFSMLIINDSQPFSGTLALIPTIATAGVIAASSKGRFFGSFIITNPIFFGIGAVSYSLYLWHWPIFQLMSEVIGPEFNEINLIIYSAILTVLTVATYFIVEKPIRDYKRLARRPSYGFVWGGAVSLIAVLLALNIMGTLDALTNPTSSNQIAQTNSNLIVINPSPTPSIAISENKVLDLRTNYPIATSTPIELATLTKAYYDTSCQSKEKITNPGKCVYGDPNGIRNLVLFGDSHATQWMPALNLIGLKNNFKVTMYTKSGCPAANLSVLYEFNPGQYREYPECAIWRSNVIAELSALPNLDLIVLAASNSYNAGSDKKSTLDYWVNGYKTTISDLQKYSDKIIILNDTPHPGNPTALDCLGKNLATPSICDMSISQTVDQIDRMDALTQVSAQNAIPLINPVPWLCFQSICPAVLDGIPAYVDGSHLSAQMSERLAPLLEQSVLSKLNG
jgi:peptidoglycan/LPS O-acetylase OafA/YrhL